MMKTMRKILVYIGGPSLFIAGFFLGILGNQLSDDISTRDSIIALILFGGVGFLNYFIFIKHIEPNIHVKSIKTEADRKNNSRRGLVVLLSPFRSFTKVELTKEQIKQAVLDKDYKSLHVNNVDITNFGPQIEAFKTHFNTLEDFWIITTRSEDKLGLSSSDYLPLLIECLRKEIDKEYKVNFHFGEDYLVNMDEDSQICESTSQVVKLIYKEAAKKGFKPGDLVVDITGGLASMKIGAALASLAKDQDVEIIGSKYDEVTGQPMGVSTSFPMIVKYRPKITKSED